MGGDLREAEARGDLVLPGELHLRGRLVEPERCPRDTDPEIGKKEATGDNVS